MTPDERAKLAVRYLAEVHGERALTRPAAPFGEDGHPAFAAPLLEKLADGGIRYTGWYEGGNGGGMTPQTEVHYTRSVKTFTPAGNIEGQKLESFTVPYEQAIP